MAEGTVNPLPRGDASPGPWLGTRERIRHSQAGITAVASISTLARSSMSAVTCTAVIAAL